METRHLVFDECLQPHQPRIIPLPGDVLEVLSNVVNRFRLERELAFASHAGTANDACALQDAKVLRHRLSRQFGATGETRDGLRFAIRQLGKHRQSCLVTQGSEYRSTSLERKSQLFRLGACRGKTFDVAKQVRINDRGGAQIDVRWRTGAASLASGGPFGPSPRQA